MFFFKNLQAFNHFESLPKYSDFLNYDECIGKFLSRSIRNNPNLFETLIFGPVKMIFNKKH